MTDQEIIEAITKAKPGIKKYLWLMDRLFQVNVATDVEFQTKYKGFYRVRQKTESWYSTYFGLLENNKGKRPTFGEILNELRDRLGNNAYEPSFTSKLVATLDPWSPVWDEHVLRNTGHNPPSYTSRTKHDDAPVAYSLIVNWYDTFMSSVDGKHWVALFNENVPEYHKITDIKKVDFILWQIRR